MYLYTRCCPQQDFCAYLFSLKGMTTNDLVIKLFQVLDFVLSFLPLGVRGEMCIIVPIAQKGRQVRLRSSSAEF